MTEVVNLMTIGFTQKSARQFFELLAKNSVKKLIDTRLNNTGQLAGFSKRDDLTYFCREIISAEYFHWQESAPEASILSAYKKKEIDWAEYSAEYQAMLTRRKVEKDINLILSGDACLLCSEAKPHHCHRSILANYLREKNASITVRHLI